MNNLWNKLNQVGVAKLHHLRSFLPRQLADTPRVEGTQSGQKVQKVRKGKSSKYIQRPIRLTTFLVLNLMIFAILLVQIPQPVWAQPQGAGANRDQNLVSSDHVQTLATTDATQSLANQQNDALKNPELRENLKQPLESRFYRANDHYENYSYKEAVQTYRSILDLGYASGPVYYNLGNSYVRLNQKGLALVNYLRAKAYIPRDPDLRSNLEYLQKELQLTNQPTGGLERIATTISDYLTVRELASWSSVLLTFLVVLILLRMYQPKSRKLLKLPVVALSLLLLVGVLTTGISGYYRYYTNPAIIVTEEAVARFEPSEQGEAHFTLKLGEQVELGSRRHEWVSVERADGKKGWLMVNQLESLGYDSLLAKGKY